jgi:hypothetical protein
MHHPFLDIAAVGAVGLGAYELWHHHHYGTFGFGNPNKQGGMGGQYSQGGFGGYGAPSGYGNHHGHHHHSF